MSGEIEKVIKYIERNPDKVNDCDENGRTYRFLVFLIFSLLHLACDRGNLETVQTLFKYDVNFTMKDQDDLLPLDYACICQQYDIIEYLVFMDNTKS